MREGVSFLLSLSHSSRVASMVDQEEEPAAAAAAAASVSRCNASLLLNMSRACVTGECDGGDDYGDMCGVCAVFF